MESRAKTNAEIDAAIRANLNEVDYGQVLLARGTTLVSMDGDDVIRRYEPDGVGGYQAGEPL